MTEDCVCSCLDTTLGIEGPRTHLGQETLLSFYSWASPSLCCMSNLRYLIIELKIRQCIYRIHNLSADSEHGYMSYFIYTIIYNVIRVHEK